MFHSTHFGEPLTVEADLLLLRKAKGNAPLHPPKRPDKRALSKAMLYLPKSYICQYSSVMLYYKTCARDFLQKKKKEDLS